LNTRVTNFLVVVNCIAYAWEISVAGAGMLTLFGSAAINKVLIRGALWPAAVLQGHQWWRIVTSAFLHEGLMHIGLNMYSLWILGRFVEPVLGSTRMLLVYAVSLVAAGLGVVYFSAPDVPTLGASGAIFGIFGALFAIGFKFGRRGMGLVRAMLPILILNLIFTFAVPQISWQAHVSGLIIGFLLTYIIYFPPRRVQPYAYDQGTGTVLNTEYQEPPQDSSGRQ
jgi:membrane associated rhomboid family serine protease